MSGTAVTGDSVACEYHTAAVTATSAGTPWATANETLQLTTIKGRLSASAAAALASRCYSCTGLPDHAALLMNITDSCSNSTP